MKKYRLIYWLPNQSKEFSNPRHFETDDKEEYEKALDTAKNEGYEIEYATTQDIQTVYKDLLNDEIGAAAREYEKAKEKAIKIIQGMTPKKATLHSGDYLKSVSDVIRAAERLEALDDAFIRFEYAKRRIDS